MKTALARSLITVLFCVCVRLTFAGNFHSAVVPAAGLNITVADHHFIRIRNFTQDGLVALRGTVSVKFGTSAPGVTVMTSSFVNTGTAALEPINSVVIAGPATVTITAATGAGVNTVITYIKEKEQTPD